MADIAFVFGWGLRDLYPLTLAELMGWRERAIQRWSKSSGA